MSRTSCLSFLSVPILAFALSSLAAVSGMPAAAQPPPGEARLAWVDVHVHPLGGRTGSADYEGAVEAAAKIMDEAGIEKMVILPPPQVFGTPPPFDYDDFRSALKKYSGRFAFLGGGGTLNSMIHRARTVAAVGDDLKQRFEKQANEILQQGAAGFGEMAVHHLSFMRGHPYESVPADHPLFLLLADIAARHDVVIDLHFDPLTEDIPLPTDDTPRPGKLTSPPNPKVLLANIAPFERLLAHNRKAKIVWAHAGSDPIGHWTVELSRRLLQSHSNLYMSLRMGGGDPRNLVFGPGGVIKPVWMNLFRDFADRFVIGNDQFIASPRIPGGGPGFVFAQNASRLRMRTKDFLSKLPEDLARKIGQENALLLYKLK